MRRGRRVAVLLAHTVLAQLIVFVLRPTMSYRALELDIPAAWLGLLGASYALAPLVMAIPAGQATDRYGERAVAMAGAALTTASAAVLLLGGYHVTGLVAAGVLLGVGHLGCIVAQQALVANTARRGGFDTAFGYYTFAASLGQVAGPVLITAAGGTAAIPDTGRVFLWALLLAAVMLALSPLLAARGTPAARGEGNGGTLRSLLGTPGIVRAVLTSCVIIAAVDIVLVYLPALGTERGLAAGTVGLLLSVRGIASMVTRLFLGRLSAVLGRRLLLIASTGVATLALVVVPLPMPLWLLYPLMVALGFGLGVGQPLTMSWVAQTAPPGLRGRAMSVRLVGNRAGQLLIPSAAGLVAAGLGASGVLWATALTLGWASVAARRLPPDLPERTMEA